MRPRPPLTRSATPALRVLGHGRFAPGFWLATLGWMDTVIPFLDFGAEHVANTRAAEFSKYLRHMTIGFNHTKHKRSRAAKFAAPSALLVSALIYMSDFEDNSADLLMACIVGCFAVLALTTIATFLLDFPKRGARFLSQLEEVHGPKTRAAVWDWYEVNDLRNGIDIDSIAREVGDRAY